MESRDRCSSPGRAVSPRYRFLRRESAKSKPRLSDDRTLIWGTLSLSVVTVGELYTGAYLSDRPTDNLRLVYALLERCRIVGLTNPVMHQFASLKADLHRSGQ